MPRTNVKIFLKKIKYFFISENIDFRGCNENCMKVFFFKTFVKKKYSFIHFNLQDN